MDRELVTRFETYLLTEKCVSHNTFIAYKTDIEQFISFLERQRIALQAVTDIHIKQYLKTLKQQHIGARSMSRKISSLKAFFRYVSEYAGYKDVTELLIFPKIEKKLPHYLSEQEVELLLRVADSDTTNQGIRNRVMLYLLYVTGMRISELVQSTISDIRFDVGFISVTGKGGKGRMVPLPQPMIPLLQNYLKTVHKSFTEKKHKTEYLFPTYYAGCVKPITRQAFWTILKGMWSKTGIKRTISPHKLRHSFATHMLKHGANLRSLQLLLGHENLSTVQIYTHLETSYLRHVYDKKHPRS